MQCHHGAYVLCNGIPRPVVLLEPYLVTVDDAVTSAYCHAVE